MSYRVELRSLISGLNLADACRVNTYRGLPGAGLMATLRSANADERQQQLAGLRQAGRITLLDTREQPLPAMRKTPAGIFKALIHLLAQAFA